MEQDNGSVKMAQGLPVTTLFTRMREFAEELAKWDGEELQPRAVADMVEYHLTPESRAQLIFQLLAAGHGTASAEGQEVNLAGKQFAALLAETMGPDWAQWLYAFTKYVTRLA